MDNTTIRKSGRGRKRERKRNKEENEYDSNPPRCETCVHRQKERMAIPGVRQYSPTYCKVGGFVVTYVGICNIWKGSNGEVLDTEK